MQWSPISPDCRATLLGLRMVLVPPLAFSIRLEPRRIEMELSSWPIVLLTQSGRSHPPAKSQRWRGRLAALAIPMVRGVEHVSLVRGDPRLVLGETFPSLIWVTAPPGSFLRGGL